MIYEITQQMFDDNPGKELFVFVRERLFGRINSPGSLTFPQITDQEQLDDPIVTIEYRDPPTPSVPITEAQQAEDDLVKHLPKIVIVLIDALTLLHQKGVVTLSEYPAETQVILQKANAYRSKM